MEKFAAGLDYSKVEKNESIQQAWQNVVPKGFETRTKALNKTPDGTLFVACENSAVTNELFMQKQDILAKINPQLEINNIVFSHKAWNRE